MNFMFANCRNFQPTNWNISNVSLKHNMYQKIVNLNEEDKKNIKTIIYFNPKNGTKYDNEKHILNTFNLNLASEDEKFIIFPKNNTHHYYTRSKKTIPTDTSIEDYNSLYEKIELFIVDKIKKRELCNLIGKGFINDALNKTDIIIIISDAKNISTNILSFAFVIFDISSTERKLHVELVCSHKDTHYAGKYLLEEIDKISKICNFEEVQLDSVPTAIDFYKKYGYIPNPNPNPMHPVDPDLTPLFKKTQKGGKKYKKHKKTKKNKKSKTKKYKKIYK
jgi:hypothetical protein